MRPMRFVEALGRADELRDLAGDAPPVEAAHAVDPERAQPRLVLDDHVGRARRAVARAARDRRIADLARAGRQVRKDRAAELHQQPASVHPNRQIVEHARARQLRRQRQYVDAAARREWDRGVAPVLQDHDRVVPALAAEVGDGLLDRPDLLDERDVARGQIAHLRLEIAGETLEHRRVPDPRSLDDLRGGERRADPNEDLGRDASDGFEQQQAGAATHDLAALPRARGQGLDERVGHEGRVERHGAAVDQRGHHERVVRRLRQHVAHAGPHEHRRLAPPQFDLDGRAAGQRTRADGQGSAIFGAEAHGRPAT